ncbi:hypothetical protein Pdw03_5490 [Penicillium digitatum]|uniref:Uncharacterized protein n=1 Tax=Penicillium digitatum TaxID=36651 RepID=A0A7T7BPZ0_PENDI|nr:hypothetical protein Pdw03_5490 [Penicillium digitatum]
MDSVRSTSRLRGGLERQFDTSGSFLSFFFSFPIPFLNVALNALPFFCRLDPVNLAFLTPFLWSQSGRFLFIHFQLDQDIEQSFISSPLYPGKKSPLQTAIPPRHI